MPSARNPCLVLNQKERRAPAARKRPLSVSFAVFSQLIAQTWSSGAQSQFSPFCAQTPWPYCVIFPATQFSWGNAAIRSHTSCVFPTPRVCPPTTIICHRIFLYFPFLLCVLCALCGELFLFSFADSLLSISLMREPSSGSRAYQAYASLNLPISRAGVPQTICPARIVFPVGMPACAPAMAPSSNVQ